jgi:hypothetical protein
MQEHLKKKYTELVTTCSLQTEWIHPNFIYRNQQHDQRTDGNQEEARDVLQISNLN